MDKLKVELALVPGWTRPAKYVDLKRMCSLRPVEKTCCRYSSRLRDRLIATGA